MNKFLAIVGLAVIPLLFPLAGKAQSVSSLHRSPFTFDKLSTRQDTAHTWVYGEITNNAKKEASTVSILVRWFDKSRRVVDCYTTIVTDLAAGKTLWTRLTSRRQTVPSERGENLRPVDGYGGTFLFVHVRANVNLI